MKVKLVLVLGLILFGFLASCDTADEVIGTLIPKEDVVKGAWSGNYLDMTTMTINVTNYTDKGTIQEGTLTLQHDKSNPPTDPTKKTLFNLLPDPQVPMNLSGQATGRDTLEIVAKDPNTDAPVFNFSLEIKGDKEMSGTVDFSAASAAGVDTEEQITFSK